MARSDLPDAGGAWRHDVPTLFHDRRQRRIGLIGGSFNPAHDGHLFMAQLARRKLRLDEVWWLVSPQNPLKSSDEMAGLAQRLADARKSAQQHKWIKIFAPEVGFNSTFTHNTLTILKKRAPRADFIWIMGADNMVQFGQWRHHRRITESMPIAVIDRPSYSYQAVAAGRKLLTGRTTSRRIAHRGLRHKSGTPFWCFIADRRHTASATALRAARH